MADPIYVAAEFTEPVLTAGFAEAVVSAEFAEPELLARFAEPLALYAELAEPPHIALELERQFAVGEGDEVVGEGDEAVGE